MEKKSASKRDSVTKIDSEQNVEDMAKFIVETTVEVKSRKDWRFRVEKTIKFTVETTIEV